MATQSYTRNYTSLTDAIFLVDQEWLAQVVDVGQLLLWAI